MATRRSRSMGLAGSKLNLPAMPHMSGCRQLWLPRWDHASSRQLVVAMTEEVERVRHAANLGALLQRLTLRAAADELKTRVGKASQHVHGRIDQHVVPFFWTEVGDDDHAAQGGPGFARVEVLHV